MAEPTSSGGALALFIMLISGVTMDLFGFPFHALAGAGVGAGIMVFFTPPQILGADGAPITMTTRRTLVMVLLSMLFGAIAGTALVSLAGIPATKASLALTSLVLAYGMQAILRALVARGVKKIEGGA